MNRRKQTLNLITENKYDPLLIWLNFKYRIIHKIAPYSFTDDKAKLKKHYYQRFGRRLNLRNPKTLPEKLQWLKLYNRQPLYTELADKYRVRNYVAKTIGKQYLNDLFGVYDHPDEIEWETLPEQFVLKANHGCQFNIICQDKNSLCINSTKNTLHNWLNEDFYARGREYQYKNIPRKIICEKFLKGDLDFGLMDYKVLCFNGEPRFIQVVADRFKHFSEIYFDTNWVPQVFPQFKPRLELEIPRPAKLDEILMNSKILSAGIPFCRLDHYYFDKKVIFGEFTFFPASGFIRIRPPEYEEILGDMIKLPQQSIHRNCPKLNCFKKIVFGKSSQ